jgi:hypothetical protein
MILRCGGSSWLLKLGILFQQGEKMKPDLGRIYAEVVKTKGLEREEHNEQEDVPEPKKCKDCHAADLQDQEMGVEGTLVAEQVESKVDQPVPMDGESNDTPGDTNKQMLGSEGKETDVLSEGFSFEALEGLHFGVGSSSKKQTSRPTYNLRGQAAGKLKKLDEQDIAGVLNVARAEVVKKGTIRCKDEIPHLECAWGAQRF